MDNNIIHLSKYRMEKAKSDLDSATSLLEDEKYAQSINRSYYSIFHATRALLAFDLFDSKKHSGIISYFNQNYIKTNKVDKKYGQILLMAERIRTKSDYDDFYIANIKEAVTQYENAKEYVGFIEKYISDNFVKLPFNC